MVEMQSTIRRRINSSYLEETTTDSKNTAPPDENGDIVRSQASASCVLNGDPEGYEDGHSVQFINNHVNGGDNDNDDGNNIRTGTISSARFNILSTLVGGSCLSLPLAFQKAGNALIGPILLLVTALMTDFCLRLLVTSSVCVHPPHATRRGEDTFESITSIAFGKRAYVLSMTLVLLTCFFGALAYSVLLRDMMEPVNDIIAKHILASSWLHKNFTMFLVILLVTPFCMLRQLTALKHFGAASITSVFILGSCIVLRSIQCNVNGPPKGGSGGDTSALAAPWYTYLTFFPKSWRDLLDVVPLFIGFFACHFNILPVLNELKEPTPARVSWWLRSTTWIALALYMIMGFFGSSYAHCTPTGQVQGNILLDFDDSDPLLMVGRMCLAMTIALAFPIWIIPARDILLRSLILPTLMKRDNHRMENANTFIAANATGEQHLEEPPLLVEDPPLEPSQHQSDDAVGPNTNPVSSGGGHSTVASASLGVLICTTVVVFWMAGVLASCVSSIDVVWNLLGSSFGIFLSYLIPAGTYLVITKQSPSNDGHCYNDNCNGRQPYSRQQFWSRILCWFLLLFFFPMMVVSTINAVFNTFFG